MPFSHVNAKRLFELENTFEKLSSLCLPEESFLFPFGAKVTSLSYEFDAKYLQRTDIESLNIVASEIAFEVYLDNVRDWDTFLILLDLFPRLNSVSVTISVTK
jgi:hypothetical protein